MATSSESIGNINRNNSNQCKPFSSLQPIKRNLDRVETERVHRVIKNGIRKIEELQMLISIISDDKKLFSVCDIILRDLLLKHQHATQRFLSTEDENEIKKRIQSSMKEIFRYLEWKSISLRIYEKDDRIWQQPVFLNYMRDLGFITLDKLLTEKEEETRRNKILLQSMEKARISRKMLSSLTAIIETKTKAKEHDINEKDRIIRQYKREIDTIASSSEEESNVKLNEAAKLILTNQKNLEHRVTKYKQEIIDMNGKLVKLRYSHYSDESQLRKRKFKMSGELQNWIMKYDQDMGWRQDEIEQIKTLSAIDTEQIRELQVHFGKVEANYVSIMDEREFQTKELEKKEREYRMRKEACVKIQCIWRGYWVRREMKKKNIKEKKKKGKKK